MLFRSRMGRSQIAFNQEQYDQQWTALEDFIKYNPGSRHRRRLIRNGLKNVTLRPDAAIADVGCGPGLMFEVLSETFEHFSYVGIDFSFEALKLARVRIPDGAFHQIDLSDHNLSNLSSPVDLAICSEVTEHLAEPENALRWISSNLKPDGKLILTTQAGRIHRTEASVGHLLHPQVNELKQWLGNAGFELESFRRWGWPGFTFLKYLTDLGGDWMLERFGSGKYSSSSRCISEVLYYLTWISSLRTSPFGPQYIILACKRA